MTASLFSEISMPDMTLPADPLWHELVAAFMASDEGRRTVDRIAADVAGGHPVYPPRVFRAMDETPSAEVRVVILGQEMLFIRMVMKIYQNT
jgi:uracil-DNA glycosylase